MSRYCPACYKARKACICASITPLQAQTKLVILQHHTETSQALATAPILELSLDSCQVLVGEDFTDNAMLNTLLTNPSYHCVLLYPSEQSVALGQSFSSAEHQGKALCVILLDGTWKKAYKMWRLSSNLHSLPSVCLPEGLCGDYRLRKAPKSHYLSTVEAGYHLLSLLEPDNDFSPLLHSFNQMIDFYMSQMPPEVLASHYGLEQSD
ncbi:MULTISPECIES: tRNA-uridine aminocarboxypropyltransferase [unclassified Vibrio]|uniref:tRNA-uridine aminocarboxypropyltransferase n=1 Tax=Vibrio sp. HB236076 TaxID=3232307 RepID=A0AB39HBB3_9VIBR|nr:tRNA-uridine aminocarboxypropyltransferase [Vibrio sp. HB161653]MDP5253827.1 tRNA-uridine aminocarboxypropyltransferase [Vibrio sp. HB161653]